MGCIRSCKQGMWRSWPPGPENVALFGNRVFSEGMKFHWGPGGGSYPTVTGVRTERGILDTERRIHRADNVHTQRKGAMWLRWGLDKVRNAKDGQKTAEAGRDKEWSSPEPSLGARPCWSLDFGLAVSKTARSWISVALKPPRSWDFLAAVLGNKATIHRLSPQTPSHFWRVSRSLSVNA